MRSELSFELVSDHISLCGEGPLWDPLSNQFYWIDIISGQIHCLSVQNQLSHFETNQKIGAIGLAESGRIIAALKNGLYYIDFIKGEMDILLDPESDKPDNRFNDGKCDPAGRFWIGTMSDEGIAGQGSLYTLEENKSMTTKLRELSISNGLAWDLARNRFYHIDTPTRQVVAYDYCNESGKITDGKPVVEIKKTEGIPDGMTIDAEGMLWIAHWNGWKVSIWNPNTGVRLGEISLPVSKVTSCTFGGQNLEDLYVTTAKLDLNEKELREQPLAGATFLFKQIGTRGLPITLIKDKNFS